MLDTILSILRRSDLAGWEVSSVTTEGWEFYFIRHALDQNRAKKVEHITVRVYCLLDDGAAIGSASCEIPPTASAREAEELIRALIFRASLVKNRPYTLRKPSEVSAMEAQEDADIAAISADYLRTMRSLPETAEEDINSYEIFVTSKTRRFVNSEGIDVTESYPSCMLEVITNARHDGHEIELYRDYHSGKCDEAFLRRDLQRTMRFGRDRLLAVPTPALGKADVLFSTADACTIYSYFADRLDAAMIYRKISPWTVGSEICSSCRGDTVTLRAVRAMPNSSCNRQYDAEGATIRDTVLIEQGRVCNLHGNRMFSSYLGLENSFIPSNYAVSGGTRSEEELRAGEYLEVVDFSDFQVDSMTGDIFGEIRLAYWHHDGRLIPVTGGSVSGSMNTIIETMQFTSATTQYDNWQIPELTLLKDVTVTGIA